MATIGSKPAARSPEQLEANKDLIRRFYHKFGVLHDFTGADEFLSADYKSFRGNGMINDRDKWLMVLQKGIATKMPNFKAELLREVAEGDYVWVLGRITGSSECPEGNITLSVDIYRFGEDGKIVEHWDVQQWVDPSVEHAK